MTAAPKSSTTKPRAKAKTASSAETAQDEAQAAKTAAKPRTRKPAAPKDPAQAKAPAKAKEPTKAKAPAKAKAATARPKAPAKGTPEQAAALRDLIVAQLDKDKAQDIVVIDLAGKSSLADSMVVASGTSARQVAAMADHLVEKLKGQGIVPRAEGMTRADWVLIDAYDVIVHLFRPEVREFYALEKMWQAEMAEEGAPVAAVVTDKG